VEGEYQLTGFPGVSHIFVGSLGLADEHSGREREIISLKDVATVGGLALVATVSATIVAPQANAGDFFAAIAYSPSTGISGGSWNYPDVRAAVDRSIQACGNHPLHPSDCRGVYAVGPPLRCLALAVGADKSQYHPGGGKTREEAENAALSTPIEGATIDGRWICNGKPGEPGVGFTDP